MGNSFHRLQVFLDYPALQAYPAARDVPDAHRVLRVQPDQARRLCRVGQLHRAYPAIRVDHVVLAYPLAQRLSSYHDQVGRRDQAFHRDRVDPSRQRHQVDRVDPDVAMGLDDRGCRRCPRVLARHLLLWDLARRADISCNPYGSRGKPLPACLVGRLGL